MRRICSYLVIFATSLACTCSIAFAEPEEANSCRVDSDPLISEISVDPYAGKWHCFCNYRSGRGSIRSFDKGYGHVDKSGQSCRAVGKSGWYSCHKH